MIKMLKRRIYPIGLDELKKLTKDPGHYLLVDARPFELYDKGHIPGAVSITEDEVETLADKYDRDMEVITYCSGTICKNSIMVAIQLIKMGFKHVYDYSPGLIDWVRHEYPVEKNY
jgi:rhodanese-related sulfurtransferase